MSGIAISKREFIKTTVLGAGALGCSFCGLNLFSKPIKAGPFLSRSSSKTPDIEGIEAKYYIDTPKGLKCLLCPNECKMLLNEESECRTRQNIDNRLICSAYGNPCAIHIDPIEKKPFYHFLPTTQAYSIATAGCNLACLNCQNWEISQSSPKKTRNYDLPPEKVVDESIINQCKSIAYTYSDPVAYYEYTLDTSIIAKEKGIKNVIVSAGYMNEKPLREWCKYIDAATIDIKSFSNEIYEMLNAGKLEPVLNSLKVYKEEGVWLEISNLVVPTWTDDLEMIKRMCGWLAENDFQDTPLHFLRFQPQYKLANLPATSVSVLTKAREIAFSAGLNYIYIGNVPGIEAENTICPKCKKIVLERKGFQIIDNHISSGKCNNCGSNINGIWE
jgi:pyruvate formate lyase activating enzyme